MSDSPSISTLITAIEQADSPGRLIAAVQALADARSEAGVPVLITTLGYNNPGAAAIAMKGLIQMGDVAVQPLLEQLDDYNYGARAWAIRALAAIANPHALDVLLSAAATDFAPSVRRAAAKGIGTLRWLQLPPEQRQPAQDRALETLMQILEDADWSIRYAALVGLQALAIALDRPAPMLQIQTRLQQLIQSESDLAVRARSQLALATLTHHLATANDLRMPMSFRTPR